MTPEERVRVEQDGFEGWCVITGGCLTTSGQSKFIANMVASGIRNAITEAVAAERERCLREINRPVILFSGIDELDTTIDGWKRSVSERIMKIRKEPTT